MEAVGEVLACEKALQNSTDQYAIVVKEDGTVIGQSFVHMLSVLTPVVRWLSLTQLQTSQATLS